jgi:hypothetical protein
VLLALVIKACAQSVGDPAVHLLIEADQHAREFVGNDFLANVGVGGIFACSRCSDRRCIFSACVTGGRAKRAT